MPMSMKNDKTYYDCILCDVPFQFGPHVYMGRHIAAWNVQICEVCIRANWNGIMTEQHPRLMEHLRKQGVPVKLNPKGWLNIPGV